jgi:hypothetical protein
MARWFRITALVSALALAVITLSAGSAGAYFERIITSSRVVATGGAFVSVADDAVAAYVNPAGLTSLPRYHMLATWNQPYGLDDVNEAFVAGAVPTGIGSFGASWFYRGVSGVSSENMLTLSYGRDLKRTSEDASLSVGAFVDLVRVSESDRFNSSDGAALFGLSAHMRPFPVIGVGYTIRNINETTLHLVDGGVGTTLQRQQSFGGSWFWDQRLIVSYERRQDSVGEWHDHGGIEFTFERYVTLRTGISGRNASAGFGVAYRGITFDVGVSSHDVLGASYIVTFGYGPPAPALPYATNP